MAEPKAGTNLLLNAGLLVGGILVIVLLYGLVSRYVLPRTDATRPSNPAELVGDIIQVEVRNGCGVDGLAATATRFLRQHRFDVVEVGNHSSSDVEKTIVIDRVGNLEAARRVALVLGLPEDRVQQDIQLDYYLDASVILGKDYAALKPFAAPDADS